MSEKRVECSLCRNGTYPYFGYTGSGVCDHCGSAWTYDETDTLTETSMRALWEMIPHWIPVQQQLPKDGKYVLAWNRCDTQIIFFDLAKWLNRNGSENKSITHWMPLPAPPTDDE